MFQGETDSISVLQRRYDVSQRMLVQMQNENRVRAECLELAMETLEWYTPKWSTSFTRASTTLAEIHRRLAELEPGEKTG